MYLYIQKCLNIVNFAVLNEAPPLSDVSFIMYSYIHEKNKYWEIYLTIVDFWTGQIIPKILYTLELYLELHRKKERMS